MEEEVATVVSDKVTTLLFSAQEAPSIMIDHDHVNYGSRAL